MSEITHYEKLKAYLPRGYRKMLMSITGKKLSKINRALRMNEPDADGIVAAAYKIASDQAKKQACNAKIIAEMQEELKKYTP